MVNNIKYRAQNRLADDGVRKKGYLVQTFRLHF